MQVEFEDVRVVMCCQQSLEVVYGAHALPCRLVIRQAMHSGYEHILVVRPVKDLYHAFCRCIFVNSPKKIMGQFFSGRFFKRTYIYALRIHTGEYIPCKPVFTAGINALYHNQHTMLVFGI